MTEEERVKFDLEKMQKELQEKEQAIQSRELTIKTVDLLKENELDLGFREFVIGADEETTIARVESFKNLWNDALEKEVSNRFKGSGREVVKSSKDNTLNPFEQVFKK